MSLRDQLAHPRGPLGWAIGHVMALRNRDSSAWALSILAPAERERILEVGFGPGTDVRRIAEAVGPRGFVGGVDVSAVMVNQAARRNKAFILEGRVILQQAGATDLPYPDGSFHAVYSLNSAQFWPDLPRGIAQIARVLRGGGRVVLAVQPMERGATDADGEKWRDRLARGLVDAGFVDVNGVIGPTSPAAGGAYGRVPWASSVGPGAADG